MITSNLLRNGKNLKIIKLMWSKDSNDHNAIDHKGYRGMIFNTLPIGNSR